MASFTDIIPQFNPYVQQLPVEAMVQVGMEKQKRYDEGIQKIQSQIDQIGGIDISKPVHKMYLQSKLNELGNNLKGVAAGDFSNFQLVNSVGGMIGQVIKDPVIKNAYESTQLLRKQQEYMETAKRNGKSSPENETWFMDQVAEWQNDPDLLRKFTGEYVEYRDLDKKLRDVYSKIKETEKSIDIPYVRDAQGNVVLRNGQPIVDDAMLRIKVKGTPAEKILNNFYSSLDEGDKRQLMITANYHYRGATKATFQNDIISTYNAQKKALSDNLSKLAVELSTNDKLTSAQKAEIEATINRGVDKLNTGAFEKEAAKEIDQIDKVQNLADFKYRLYTQKYLTGLAQDLSNISYTEEILSNPYAQMAMEKKKLEFQVNRARVEDAQFWASYGLRKSELDLNVLKFQTERADKAAEARAKEPITRYGGLGTGAEVPDLEGVRAIVDNLKKDVETVDSKYGPLLYGTLPANEQLKSLKNLKEAYRANPTSITDPNQLEYLRTVTALEDDKLRKEQLILSGEKATAKFQEDLKNAFKGASGYSENGKEVYTAEELYKAVASVNNATTSVRGGGALINEEKAYEGLSPRIKAIAQSIVKARQAESVTGWDWVFNLNRKPTRDELILKRAYEVTGSYRNKVSEIYGNKIKAEKDFLSQRMPEIQSSFGTLNMEDAITKQRVNELIGNATNYYNKMGALDVNNPDDFRPKTASEILGEKDSKFVLEKNFDGSGRLTLYGKDNTQVIPLTSSDINAYFPSFAQTSFMTKIKYDVLSSPELTTNPLGRGKPAYSTITGYDIAGLRNSPYASRVRIDIEGSSNNDGSENDRFAVRMYAFDESGVWKESYLNQQGFIGPAGVEEILRQIGPVTVEEILRKK